MAISHVVRSPVWFYMFLSCVILSYLNLCLTEYMVHLLMLLFFLRFDSDTCLICAGTRDEMSVCFLRRKGVRYTFVIMKGVVEKNI